MDAEANKSLVRRYMKMWNTGNLALADEVLARDWVDHAQPEARGPEAVKQAVSKARAVFPDFRITIESIVSESDLVALRGTVVRKENVLRLMWFVRIVEGKMAEMWTGTEAVGRP